MDGYMQKVIQLINLREDIPLNQIVYKGLRTAIIKGIIPVGERINEQKYSTELNVSRTPIREALYSIHAEGLIEYIPHYGFIIKKVTVEDAIELYKIRVALDELAFVNAMHLMTDDQFKNMRALLDNTEEMEDKGNIAEVIKLFAEFNNMVYEYSNMPRLRIMIDNMRDYVARFRDISLFDENRRKKAFDEHKLLFYCLRDKDENELKILLKKHLEYSKKYVIKEIKKIEDQDN